MITEYTFSHQSTLRLTVNHINETSLVNVDGDSGGYN